MVGALRAGHVGDGGRGGRGLGRGGRRGRGRGAATRVRGLHLLRQVRGRAPGTLAPQGRLRAPAAARRQDEGNPIGLSEL